MGILRGGLPTTIRYKLVKGADYMSPSGREITKLTWNVDGTLQFGGARYRRVLDSGSDAELLISFQTLLNETPDVVAKLRKADLCLHRCKPK